MNTPDRALGAMLGLAMAESWAKTDAPISATSPLPGNGQWADGTAMALALAESLSEMNGVDQRDQMIRYTSWFRYGYLSAAETCPDIDDAVREAILRFERTWNPIDTEHTEGNACLTRLAPVAIFSESAEQARRDAALCTQTTHAGENSVATAQFVAAMLFHTVHGHREQLARMEAPKCTSSILSMPLAVKNIIGRAENFAQGCEQCRPLGLRGMAVYGQLAGATFGANVLPPAWRASLAKSDLIERLTSAMTNL